MHPVITKRTLFKLALAIAVLVISYLVFSRPNYPQNIPNLDKLGHIGSFFCLAYLSYLAFRPKWYLLSLALSGYAVLIELVQSRLPYRSASTADVVADLVGITLFYFLLWGYRRYFPATGLAE
nr:VanZ family protein [Shewanella salipaludis]